ncbi:MAG: rhodanese-like domain-containing protein [Candidatus Dasytiphilus stammeri]
MQQIVQFYSNHPVLFISWIMLLFFLVFSTIQTYFYKFKTISCNEATLLINKANAKVIDIRSYEEYCQGHIYNSINILASDIKKGKYQIIDNYQLVPIIIVSTDTHGMKQIDSAIKLTESGFKKVFILESGINGWNKANLPLVRR